MAYYRRKGVVEAHRWFQNGDHPLDQHEKGTLSEGKIVRRFRRPDLKGDEECAECGYLMHDHGWIDSVGDGKPVCPGDYIVNNSANLEGDFYPRRPEAFEEEYQKEGE